MTLYFTVRAPWWYAPASEAVLQLAHIGMVVLRPFAKAIARTNNAIQARMAVAAYRTMFESIEAGKGGK